MIMSLRAEDYWLIREIAYTTRKLLDISKRELKLIKFSNAFPTIIMNLLESLF